MTPKRIEVDTKKYKHRPKISPHLPKLFILLTTKLTRTKKKTTERQLNLWAKLLQILTSCGDFCHDDWVWWKENFTLSGPDGKTTKWWPYQGRLDPHEKNLLHAIIQMWRAGNNIEVKVSTTIKWKTFIFIGCKQKKRTFLNNMKYFFRQDWSCLQF